MKYDLPPLNALKAFESAARNLSFTRAANELFITQGAISKQVKLLEQHLGFPLFKRVHQGLILTDKALKYYQDIHIIFNKISEATRSIKLNEKSSTLQLNILPSVSSLLIAPNIESFKKKYGKNINLNIKASDSDIDLEKGGADIFIRCSKNEFPNFNNIKLTEEEMLMISSTGISKQIADIDDITKQNIILHGSRPHILENWIRKNSLESKALNKISFEHFFMIIEAVRNNVGVGFAPSFLVWKMIQNQELVNILNISYKTRYNYYILHKDNNEKIKSFCNWLKELINF